MSPRAGANVLHSPAPHPQIAVGRDARDHSRALHYRGPGRGDWPAGRLVQLRARRCLRPFDVDGRG